MKPGDDVVYVGCGHEEACPEMVRPCSVDMYGCMELRQVRPDGRLVARLDSGEFEVFEAIELDTVAAVAARAGGDSEYVDYDPDAGKGSQ